MLNVTASSRASPLPQDLSVTGGSADQARPLVIECPPRNQKLHRHAVIPSAQAHAFVEFMGLGQLVHIELDTQSRFLRHLHAALDYLQWGFGQALAVLPDPVGVDGSDFTRRG